MGLPKAFIVATVIYIITRVARVIDRNIDNDFPVTILGFVAACIMVYTGVVYLLSLI